MELLGSLGWFHLGGGKCSIFPEEVGIPVTTQSSQSQDSTPMDWKWWAMGLLPVARSCWQGCSELTELPLPGCTTIGRGWMWGREWVCTSTVLLFLMGLFAMNTDHLGGKFFPVFYNMPNEDFTAWQNTVGWGRRIPESVESFAQYWWALECYDFICTIFRLLTLDQASVCASRPSPIAASAPTVWSGQSFTAIASARAKMSVGIHAALSLSFSLPVPSLLFTQICPSADVSMHDVSDVFVC